MKMVNLTFYSDSRAYIHKRFRPEIWTWTLQKYKNNMLMYITLICDKHCKIPTI